MFTAIKSTEDKTTGNIVVDIMGTSQFAALITNLYFQTVGKFIVVITDHLGRSQEQKIGCQRLYQS